MKYIILFLGLVALCKGSSFSGRIINSIPSAPDDDYAVTVFSAISALDFQPQSYLSTGAAISSEFIVVSGQAVYGFGAWRIGANSINRLTQEVLEVTGSYLHDKFDPQTLEFNIGVLRVLTPIARFLPVAVEEPGFPILFTIGFGFNTVDELDLPNISQQAAIQPIELNDCRLVFNQRVVRPFNFCGNSVAPLSGGDQGGPAVNFQRDQIYGIVSFWNPLRADRNPTVFTSLTHPEIASFLQPFL